MQTNDLTILLLLLLGVLAVDSARRGQIRKQRILRYLATTVTWAYLSDIQRECRIKGRHIWRDLNALGQRGDIECRFDGHRFNYRLKLRGTARDLGHR